MQENSHKNSRIKRKISQYLKERDISDYKFYKETGISNGTLRNDSGMSEPNIEKFLAFARDIDANWLFDLDPVEVSAVNEPEVKYTSSDDQENYKFLIKELRQCKKERDQLSIENDILKQKLDDIDNFPNERTAS
jgi:hypothetical protein